MKQIERLLEIIRENHMAKEHEDYGYPRGWNAHAEFVEMEIEKILNEHSVAERGNTSAI
jgi:hypothetical protein